MGFKDELDREKEALMSSRRPYETAAFLIFTLLFLQQIAFLVRAVYLFVKNGWFVVPGVMNVGNYQSFFGRIIAIDSTKWTYVILALLSLVLYYFIVYLLVWGYCKKRNLAKWTWTTLIVFGPSLLFMPAYMFYILYVFREYFFRFVKIIIEEYKAFNPKEMALLEAKMLEEEDLKAAERASSKKEKDSLKAVEKEQKEVKKSVKSEKTEEDNNSEQVE